MTNEERIAQLEAEVQTLRFQLGVAVHRLQVIPDDAGRVASTNVATAYALADALIVTGPATGSAAARADVETVRQVAGGVPVLVGSGVDPDVERGIHCVLSARAPVDVECGLRRAERRHTYDQQYTQPVQSFHRFTSGASRSVAVAI